MANRIRIQLMDHFSMTVNDVSCDELLNKSPKGIRFMQYLLLHRGEAVPAQRILEALWNNENSQNPENALKTMISRLRTTLNRIVPGLAKCVDAGRGFYRWECMEGVSVDMYELQDTFAGLASLKSRAGEYMQLCDTILSLYRGDLLLREPEAQWMLPARETLHSEYVNAVYGYAMRLKAEERFRDMIAVCRTALDVDPYDDRIHMELMGALIALGQTEDAFHQYKQAAHIARQDLDAQPSRDMQAFYQRIVEAGKTLDHNAELILNELKECKRPKGAYICEYSVFKDVYNLETRNLGRLGFSVYLGVMMVESTSKEGADTLKQNNIANTMLNVLRNHLRRGDTVSHVSPSVFALLLPMVNRDTGTAIMERIKKQFYLLYPNSDVTVNYRLIPLNDEKPYQAF